MSDKIGVTHSPTLTLVNAVTDEALSYRARGLAYNLASYGYVPTARELAKTSPTEGVAAIQSALNELASSGLIDLPEPAPECATCGVVARSAASLTYVVQRQGWVKIGSTSNITSRIFTLAKGGTVGPWDMLVAEPLILLAVIESNVEHDLHTRFSGSHVAGEWFLPDADMRAWIGEVSA